MTAPPRFAAWIPGYEGMYKITPRKELWSFTRKTPRVMKQHQGGRVNLTKNGAQVGYNVDLLLVAAYPTTFLPTEMLPEHAGVDEEWLHIAELEEFVHEPIAISNLGRIRTANGTVTHGAPYKQYRTFAGVFIHQLIYVVKFGDFPHPNRHVHAPDAPLDSEGILSNHWTNIVDT